MASGDAVVFDEATLLAQTGGEAAFARTVAAVFAEDTAELARRLAAAAGAGDAGEMARLAHSIKGAAANVGGVRLREAALATETAGRADDLAGARAGAAALAAAFDELCAALRAAGYCP